MNDLIEKIRQEESVKFKQQAPKKLKEMLGHEPEEVLGGAILGILVGMAGYKWEENDRKMSKFRLRF